MYGFFSFIFFYADEQRLDHSECACFYSALQLPNCWYDFHKMSWILVILSFFLGVVLKWTLQRPGTSFGKFRKVLLSFTFTELWRTLLLEKGSLHYDRSTLDSTMTRVASTVAGVTPNVTEAASTVTWVMARAQLRHSYSLTFVAASLAGLQFQSFVGLVNRWAERVSFTALPGQLLISLIILSCLKCWGRVSTMHFKSLGIASSYVNCALIGPSLSYW